VEGVAVSATLFFSYSHIDEALRDQLEKHLAGLHRQDIISSWHDRRITAGTEFGDAIDSHIDTADVILLLVSPDFIASDYCYEKEMVRALERHQKGQARVIPVILRPCDWHGLPFGKLLATPTDGRAITRWPNIDEAFLDVVKAIKAALNETGQSTPRGAKQQVLRHADTSFHEYLDPAISVLENNLRTWTKTGFDTTDSNTSRNSLRTLLKNWLSATRIWTKPFAGLMRTRSLQRHTGVDKSCAKDRLRYRVTLLEAKVSSIQ
jgi:hypothetical protein